MNKEEKNLNNAENPKLGISDVMCSGYVIKFNEADTNGIIINNDAINIKDLDKLKVAGTIVDYAIDDTGVKIYVNFKKSPKTPKKTPKKIKTKAKI